MRSDDRTGGVSRNRHAPVGGERVEGLHDELDARMRRRLRAPLEVGVVGSVCHGESHGGRDRARGSVALRVGRRGVARHRVNDPHGLGRVDLDPVRFRQLGSIAACRTRCVTPALAGM